MRCGVDSDPCSEILDGILLITADHYYSKLLITADHYEHITPVYCIIIVVVFASWLPGSTESIYGCVLEHLHCLEEEPDLIPAISYLGNACPKP